MKPSPLVVIGDGGHAASVADAAVSSGFEVLGFMNAGFPAGGFNSLLESVALMDLVEVALALGIGTNLSRQLAFETIQSTFPKSHFPPIAHSTAWISPSASIGSGSVVLAHSSVGPNASLGLGSLLNTGASLDHDGELGNFASLGPGARTGGNVKIGPRTMIGLQAGILQGRTVGEDSVVGAQSLVLADIPALGVAVGSPCRVIRSRERDERYY